MLTLVADRELSFVGYFSRHATYAPFRSCSASSLNDGRIESVSYSWAHVLGFAPLPLSFDRWQHAVLASTSHTGRESHAEDGDLRSCDGNKDCTSPES